MNLSLGVAGAVPAGPPDEQVAGHFGEPAAEQRALEQGPAVVDRSHRGVVLVGGPERREWLHQLTSQHLSGLEPGRPSETLVLSPHGHVEYQAEVVDDGERTWLLVDGAVAPGLAGFLDSMRFLTRVEVQDASADWAVLTLRGAQPPAGTLVRSRAWPAGTVDALVPASAAAAAWSALLDAGTRPAGHDAFEALRIAAGAARAALDVDARTLAHEVGWVGSAVHLDKGCYRGQETVARVHNLGRPPRRLCLVHLDGSDHLLPALGSAVLADGRTVGLLTSVARHFELGPIGLALLRRAVSPDTALRTEEGIGVAIERDVSSPTEPVDLGSLRARR